MDFKELFSGSLKQAIMITCFVMVMMLVIEFINVFSKGRFSYSFKNKPILQVFLASLLGAIPGCLGTYAVVSLFTHNVMGLGALMAAMIATTGDEAFIMFSMIPRTAIQITLFLFILSIIVGVVIQLFEKKKKSIDENIGFPVHKKEINDCVSVKWESIIYNFKFITFRRALLIVSLLIFITSVILGLFAGFHGHSEVFETGHDHHGAEAGWINITFFVLSLCSLIITILATNHFLDHHLWEHIIKVHFLRIFLWTFITLLIIGILTHYIDIEYWVTTQKYSILLFALLIGLIPVSGPHIVFITLYFTGVIPVSILIANSIVQDGHGGLPLLAESKKNFLFVKFFKLFIAAIICFIALSAGL